MDYVSAFGNVLLNNAPNLVGFALPAIVEFANHDIKDERLRFLMEIVVCFAFAIVLQWHMIAIGDPEKAVTTAGILFTESEVLFTLYFKKSWLRGKIQGIAKRDSGVDTTASQ